MTSTGLHELIERTRSMIDRLQETTADCTRVAAQSLTAIHEAKEVAEHARATSEGNERIFRTLMNASRAQTERFELLEQRVGRLEASKGDPTS